MTIEALGFVAERRGELGVACALLDTFLEDIEGFIEAVQKSPSDGDLCGRPIALSIPR